MKKIFDTWQEWYEEQDHIEYLVEFSRQNKELWEEFLQKEYKNSN